MSSALSLTRPYKILDSANMAASQAPILDVQATPQIGLQVAWTKDTLVADTALAGVSSLLAVQDITYTAVTRGTAGDDIEIEYVDGAVLAVAVVGTVVTVTLETGVSTATLVKAAIDGSAAALALVTCAITGTAGDVQVAEAATPLAGGVNSDVNATDDEFTLTAHTFQTGLKIALTSSGTLPTGLSATDYYVIVVDANTIQLASSLANAEAGTAVTFSSQGASGSTITFTPGALAGVIAVQGSNDYNPHLGTGTFYSLTFSPTLAQPADNNSGYLVGLTFYWKYIKILYTPTTGQGELSVTLFGRGT